MARPVRDVRPVTEGFRIWRSESRFSSLSSRSGGRAIGGTWPGAGEPAVAIAGDQIAHELEQPQASFGEIDLHPLQTLVAFPLLHRRCMQVDDIPRAGAQLGRARRQLLQAL